MSKQCSSLFDIPSSGSLKLFAVWKPSSDSDGVPIEHLVQASKSLSEWRTAYLDLVGVPKNVSGNWNFVEVILPQMGF